MKKVMLNTLEYEKIMLNTLEYEKRHAEYFGKQKKSC